MLVFLFEVHTYLFLFKDGKNVLEQHLFCSFHLIIVTEMEY